MSAAEQSLAHRLSCRPLVTFEQVPVHVLGDGDAGMPEHLGDHGQRRALGQHQRRARRLYAWNPDTGRASPQRRPAGPLHPPGGLPVGRDGLGDAALKVGGDDQQPLLDEVEDGGGDEAAGAVARGLPVWRGVELGLAVGRLHGIVDEGGGLVGV